MGAENLEFYKMLGGKRRVKIRDVFRYGHLVCTSSLVMFWSSLWLAKAGYLNDCLLWSLGILGMLSVKRKSRRPSVSPYLGELPSPLHLMCLFGFDFQFMVVSILKFQFSFCCKLGIRRNVP